MDNIQLSLAEPLQMAQDFKHLIMTTHYHDMFDI
jgi:hypothetical protein